MMSQEVTRLTDAHSSCQHSVVLQLSLQSYGLHQFSRRLCCSTAAAGQVSSWTSQLMSEYSQGACAELLLHDS